MIEIRLEGLPADIDAAHERLASVFDILSTSRDYSNRGSKLVRRFVKVEVKASPTLDKDRLTFLIRTFLEISHAELQTAVNVPDTLAAYHGGYQAALMDLARSTGVVPDSEPETDKLADLYEQVLSGKLTEAKLTEANNPPPDPKHGEKRLCANCGNGIQYSQFSGWHHTDLEPMIFDPETRSISGICGKPEPKPKRKRGRPKTKGQGFWLQTESGPVHVLGNPARANDPEFRAAIEEMARAAKREAEKP